MEIDEKKLKSAYEKACGNSKAVLEELFPFLRGDVTERIKTFDDAVRELGDDNQLVREYNAVSACRSSDLVAYLKLRIIAAALNEGWEPQFSDEENRYYPWFYLYSEKELNGKSAEWKKNRAIRSCKHHVVAFGGLASDGANAVFVCAIADTIASYANASVGYRICFKTEALAEYSGKQFIDIWMDFNLIRK